MAPNANHYVQSLEHAKFVQSQAVSVCWDLNCLTRGGEGRRGLQKDGVAGGRQLVGGGVITKEDLKFKILN